MREFSTALFLECSLHLQLAHWRKHGMWEESEADFAANSYPRNFTLELYMDDLQRILLLLQAQRVDENDVARTLTIRELQKYNDNAKLFGSGASS